MMPRICSVVKSIVRFIGFGGFRGYDFCEGFECLLDCNVALSGDLDFWLQSIGEELQSFLWCHNYTSAIVADLVVPSDPLYRIVITELLVASKARSPLVASVTEEAGRMIG